MKDKFDYHKPTDEQKEDMQANRDAYKALYAQLETLPDGREKSLALTRLEESAVWANKAIVFEEK